MIALRLAAALAALTALAVPTTAAADHTAHLDAAATSEPSCQVRGLWLTGFDHPAGSLAEGNHRYAVAALDGAGQPLAAACPAEIVATSGGADAVLLNWRAAPGASAYRVFRGAYTGPGSPDPQALVVAAGPTTAVPAASLGCAEGGRCTFADTGLQTAPQIPAFAAERNQAGLPADLRIVQRIDYGGVDPNSSALNTSDDPFPAAVRSSVLRFPPGLVPDPGAAPRCPLTGESSLLGDPAEHGSDDPDEDSCPAASLVGTVRTVSRVPDPARGADATRIQVSVGDIFNGEPKPGEAGRLFVVIRPACSAGSPVAPGSDTCKAALGQPAGAPKDFEVEKEFLASVASIVDRGAGALGVDAVTVRAEDDGPLPAKLGILVPGTGGDLRRAPAGASPDVQVRELRQTLFGVADQGTPAAGDDRAFLVLPTSCAAKSIEAEAATHQHGTAVTDSIGLQAGGCANVPFAPSIEALLGGPGQNAPDGLPGLTVTIRQAPGEAAVRSATVTLPRSVGPALTGISAVCSKSDFARGACPAETLKGEASATTPLLPVALTGPVHLVDNAPELPQIGVTLSGGPMPAVRFTGDIDLTENGLVNRFGTLPEVALTSFSLRFAGGPGALLQNVVDLCGDPGAIAATFEGFNGATSQAATRVQVDQAGCPSVPPVPPAPVATASLSKVRTGSPTLRVKLTGVSGRRLRTVKLTLPKGLSFKKGKARRKIAVRVGGKALRGRPRGGRRTLRIDSLKAGRVQITAGRGTLRASRKLRKRGKRQRLAFKLTGSDTNRAPYRVRVKVRPSS